MKDYLGGLNGRVLVAAHRGLASGNVPCNSIPGYKAALKTGADVLFQAYTVVLASERYHCGSTTM